MAEKQCAACGEANQADNSFCTSCGAGAFKFKQEQSPPAPVVQLTDDERQRIYEEEKAKEQGRQGAQEESEKAKSVGLGPRSCSGRPPDRTPAGRTFAQEAKKRKEKTQGCLGLIVLFIAVTVCSVIVFDGDEDGSTSGPTSVPRYVGGKSACTHFRNVFIDFRDGVLSFSELRQKLQEVRGSGSTAEPPIRAASTEVLAAVTDGDYPRFLEAASDLVDACYNY
jgi:hypothetical protein